MLFFMFSVYYLLICRCRLFDIARLNELTVITWIDSSPNEESNEVFGETTMHFDSTPILGYISDVKVLTAENRIYLVFGIGYNANLGAHFF